VGLYLPPPIHFRYISYNWIYYDIKQYFLQNHATLWLIFHTFEENICRSLSTNYILKLLKGIWRVIMVFYRTIGPIGQKISFFTNNAKTQDFLIFYVISQLIHYFLSQNNYLIEYLYPLRGIRSVLIGLTWLNIFILKYYVFWIFSRFFLSHSKRFNG